MTKSSSRSHSSISVLLLPFMPASQITFLHMEIIEIWVQFHFTWRVYSLHATFICVVCSKLFLFFISLSYIQAYILLLILYNGNVTHWITLWKSWLMLLNCAANLCCRDWSVYILWYPVITTSGFICLGALLETEQMKDWSGKESVCVFFLLALLLILMHNNLYTKYQAAAADLISTLCSTLKSFYEKKA